MHGNSTLLFINFAYTRLFLLLLMVPDDISKSQIVSIGLFEATLRQAIHNLITYYN